MSEDELVAYLGAARARRGPGGSGLAVSMLVWGFMDNVEGRVAMKVPAHAIEEVAQSVLLSALTSDFDGSSVGEFRKWISTIVERRIADYHRDPKRDVRLDPLPTEHLGDDEIWGDEPSVEFEGEAIDAQRARRAGLRRAEREAPAGDRPATCSPTSRPPRSASGPASARPTSTRSPSASATGSTSCSGTMAILQAEP